ncbi:MAG TPA: CPBP family intramembrane glutamic endopeptidase [Candidatus Eremiobacteraceae bacterium]|nr:CPBP family intramembrane glutamic endopeptidase [Candidatus Eremiobacteraceae bacterium]
MNHSILVTVALLAILMLALPVMSVLTGRRIKAAPPGRLTKLWRYARTLVILWSLTALALYALRLHGLGAADVGLRPPHRPLDFIAGLLFVAVMVAFGSARRTIDGEYRRAISAIVPATQSEWLLFIPLAATAGICEEFLYRGYALWVIQNMTGSVWAAALISSLAFGLAHAYQGRAGVIGATVSGLFYASVFLYSGSLLPCMLGHFAQDIAGAILLRRVLGLHTAPAPEAA